MSGTKHQWKQIYMYILCMLQNLPNNGIMTKLHTWAVGEHALRGGSPRTLPLYLRPCPFCPHSPAGAQNTPPHSRRPLSVSPTPVCRAGSADGAPPAPEHREAVRPAA
ncbi:hypothetical protein KIL84_018267 [Mauremys mutica]|uniref:Uncharacterized protein n=1 Tax=Mauremys mutica TaxID=74926 RepID=A0A9D4B8U3_9SAUR|nr:hypothetical protein KIL84_018267 [Mauremys mutica]